MNGLGDDVDHYGTIYRNQSELVRNKRLFLLRVTAGLYLARLADLPLTQAGEVAHSLGGGSTRSLESSESSKVARRRKPVLEVRCDTSSALL